MCVVIGEAETEFKFLHQIEDKAVHVRGILTCIEDARHITEMYRTLLLLQFVRIEDFINTIGDPMGIQDVRILQTWVVFILTVRPFLRRFVRNDLQAHIESCGEA